MAVLKWLFQFYSHYSQSLTASHARARKSWSLTGLVAFLVSLKVFNLCDFRNNGNKKRNKGRKAKYNKCVCLMPISMPIMPIRENEDLGINSWPSSTWSQNTSHCGSLAKIWWAPAPSAEVPQTATVSWSIRPKTSGTVTPVASTLTLLGCSGRWRILLAQRLTGKRIGAVTVRTALPGQSALGGKEWRGHAGTIAQRLPLLERVRRSRQPSLKARMQNGKTEHRNMSHAATSVSWRLRSSWHIWQVGDSRERPS